MSTQTTVDSLSGSDIGRLVTIEWRGVAITGPLAAIEFSQQWVDLTTYSNAANGGERIPGRKTARLSIGGWSATGVAPDVVVEVHP